MTAESSSARTPRGILQLDFDGTLVEGDVSTAILGQFAGPDWPDRVDHASRAMLVEPDSAALVGTMSAGYAELSGDHDAYLAFARKHHPARNGLPRLVEVARWLGLQTHVVSNGFAFYIRAYLRDAGVESHVQVHTGEPIEDGRLVYLNPDGRPAAGRFKLSWAEHFLSQHDLLVYVGDGTSDLAPASLARLVFARDSLLAGMSPGFTGSLRPFDTLDDVAAELEELLGSG
jgi:HAD superfamily phosphoserine phosphatase-like hydrolase